MSDGHTSDRRRERFSDLWKYELSGAGMLSFFFMLFQSQGWVGPATAVGMAPAVLILLQGSLYWYSEMRTLDGRPLWPQKTFVQLFRTLRLLDLAVLIICGGALLVMRPTGSDAAWGIGLYALGWLEYVNYFHWQLMYDNRRDIENLRRHRGLKKARLGAQLRALGG